MKPTDDPGLSALGDHVEGLRRLAYCLVANRDDAEDAVQESLLVAVRRGPARVLDLGAWLRGVVRNKVREAGRSGDRRRRHEAAIPHEGRTMDASEVAARLETQEKLIQAVKDLPEPARVVVWMHFFESVPTRDVAQRLSLPLETVRTRLKRGVAQLREDLDRRHAGGRSAWMAVLAPFAAAAPAAEAAGVAAGGAAMVGGTAALTSKAMGTVAAVVVVVGLAVAGGAWALFGSDGGTHGGAAPETSLDSGETGAAGARSAVSAPTIARPPDARTSDGHAGGDSANGGAASGPRLAGSGGAPRRGRHAEAHEGTFQFHYKQGWSFLTKSIVPVEEADLVFETCAGGISSVTLAAPGGGIASLSPLQGKLPKDVVPSVLNEEIVRAFPDKIHLATRADGDDRQPSSDVFVLKTSRGEWVRLAILERGTSGGWTELPVTIAYALKPGAPEFGAGHGSLVASGFEVDVDAIGARARAAVEAAKRKSEEDALERERLAAPIRKTLAELDRRAEALEAAGRDGEGVHVAAVLDRGFAAPLGGNESYVAATYSFEKATRDDAKATRNDWDFVFGNGHDWISVRTVTDDHSVVRDLGFVDMDAARRGDVPPGEVLERAQAIAGHVYAIHTLDSDTDLWTLIRVVDVQTDGWMVFAWTIVKDPSGLRRVMKGGGSELRSPRAVLQVRTGAGGGNPNRVFLDGTANQYVDVVSSKPLDLTSKPDSHEPTRAYAEGGSVPEGKVFVVDSIAYLVRAEGDSNGHGEITLKVGGTELLHLRPRERTETGTAYDWFSISEGVRSLAADAVPVRGRLSIPFALRPGDEKDVCLEAANSSFGEVVLEGRFVDDESASSDFVAAMPRKAARDALWLLRDLSTREPEPTGDTGFGRLDRSVVPWLEAVEPSASAALRRRIETVLRDLRK